MAELKKQFVFVHIPKTAGTTFAIILTRQFRGKAKLSFYPPRSRADYPKFSNEQKNKYDLVYGHLALDTNQKLERGTEFYTFLRSPRERLLSGYKHIKGHGHHLIKQQKDMTNYTLKDLLKQGLAKNMDNSMTRYLSGTLDKAYLSVNEEDLKRALKNFDAYFPVFGLTEYFDESLVILSDYMNWQPLYYVKENKASYKIDPKELDEETEALILPCNRFDQVIYDHALTRFKKMMTDKKTLIDKGVIELRDGNKRKKTMISITNKAHLFYYSLHKLFRK